jgi:hypothetical protein
MPSQPSRPSVADTSAASPPATVQAALAALATAATPLVAVAPEMATLHQVAAALVFTRMAAGYLRAARRWTA